MASSRTIAAPRKASRYIILTGMMLLCIMSVSACGKKAAHVDPPTDDGSDTYPLIYPDPKMNK